MICMILFESHVRFCYSMLPVALLNSLYICMYTFYIFAYSLQNEMNIYHYKRYMSHDIYIEVKKKKKHNITLNHITMDKKRKMGYKKL